MCGNADGDCLYPSHLQRLFGVRGEEDRGLIHIDYVFFHNLSHLLFLYQLHEIECIWCCLCRRAFRNMSTHPVPQSCVFNDLYIIKDFAPSDLAWKIWQIRYLSWHNLCHHYHFLLMKLEDISHKKIIKRHQTTAAWMHLPNVGRKVVGHMVKLFHWW